MSLTGKKQVTAGEFEMNMAAVQVKGGKCGEQGTIKFTPNATAKDTNNLRLLQVVKLVDASTSSDYQWTGGEARRNDVMTQDNHATAIGAAAGAAGGAAAGAAMGGAVGAVVGGVLGGIAGGVAGSTQQVEGGFFVDHAAASATPRSNAADPAVSPYYRDYWANSSSSQDGHKKGAGDIQPASLWDFPGWSKDCTFKFETAAQGADNNVTYGTVKWQFAVRSSAVVDESWSVQDNPSATFNAAVDRFNEVYKNPGASTAPAAPAPASSSPPSSTP